MSDDTIVVRFRIRGHGTFYTVEKRRERRFLGFWPVYEYVIKGTFDTKREAIDYIDSLHGQPLDTI